MSDVIRTADARCNGASLQGAANVIAVTPATVAGGNLLDAMACGINTIRAAINGIAAITALVQSAQAIATRALQTDDATLRAELAIRFDAIRARIDLMAANSGFSEVNLLNKAGNSGMTIPLHESGTPGIAIAAVDFTTGGGLAIAASREEWTSDANIRSAAEDLTAALTTLRAQAQAFGADLSMVQIRQDFMKTMIDTLQTGARRPTSAGCDQEGENLLALQTRQRLSTTALSLATQASRAVLRQFQ
jgi:flagellin-like hook-associated protein FlgL